MSTKTTTTAQKLQMTAEDYENMIFGSYARWCESVTINMRDFQAVLSNAAVNAWFLMELTKCETEFHQITDCYVSSCTAYDMQVSYNESTFRLFNLRPMPLLEKAKTKTPKGTQVFNSILQN